MIVTGIDPSLTCTGVARASDTQRPTTWSIPTTGHLHDSLGMRNDRLAAISSRVLQLGECSDLVVIEAPSVGSRGGSAWDRAGLWWRIVHRLLAQELTVVQIPPTTRAKWSTGKGNADKAAVGGAMARLWPDVECRNSDEADALALASIGMHLLGHRPFLAVAYREAALAKVQRVGAR